MSFKKTEVKANEIKGNVINITRAKLFEASEEKPESIVFDMVVNGVSIYGCHWVEGEKNGNVYKFVAFPSYKNKNKYWNHAYINLKDNDLASIESQLHKLIDCE